MPCKNSRDHVVFLNYLVKETIQCYLTPLTALVNQCINQRVFPDILKISKIHPIFKKGDPHLASNYRPIAIVPIFSKVIEKVIGQQLVHYMEQNELFCKGQF